VLAPAIDATPPERDRPAATSPPAASAPAADTPSNEVAETPATGRMTCTKCGRLGERALCEACRDALQELHALSLG
jgi:hypothetical protein